VSIPALAVAMEKDTSKHHAKESPYQEKRKSNEPLGCDTKTHLSHLV
jgi:hypothetical protein